MANAAEFKPVVGLSDVYVAKVLQDDVDAFLCDTPLWLGPATEASAEPTTSTEIFYADNQPYETMTSEGDTKITMSISNFASEILAMITGKVFDTVSGRVFDNAGVPDYYALGYKSKKSNGKYKFTWYLKGRFTTPKEEATTQGEKMEPKPGSIEFGAIKTVYQFDLGDVTDSVKRVMGDEDTTNFVATGWFTQVQTPVAAAPSALALSTSVPADGAAAQVVTVNVVLTFNNILPVTAINHVALVKADGTIVAAAVTLDSTRKIITINPTASLDASSTYIAVIAITDIYGQALNAAVNFATA